MWKTLKKTEEVCEKTAQIHLKSGDDTRWVYMQKLDDCEKIRDRLSLADPAAWEGYQGRGKAGSGSGDIPCDHNKPSAERNQFAACTEFDIENGQTKEIQLTLRKAELKDMLEEIRWKNLR